jgi:hypothetical protein
LAQGSSVAVAMPQPPMATGEENMVRYRSNRVNDVASQMFRSWSGQHLGHPWTHPPPVRESLVGVSGLYVPTGRVVPRTLVLPPVFHSHNEPSWAKVDSLTPSQLERRPPEFRWLQGLGQTRDVREAQEAKHRRTGQKTRAPAKWRSSSAAPRYG